MIVRRAAVVVILAGTVGAAGCGSRSSDDAKPKIIVAVSDAGARHAAGPPDAGAPLVEKRPRLPPEVIEITRLEGARQLADGRLAALAQSEFPRIRYRVALAFGRIGGAAAVALLQPMLGDQERGVQLAAIQGLGLCGPAAAALEGELAQLVGTRRDNPDWDPTVFTAIARVGGVKAAAVLAAGLDEKNAPPPRVSAALGLGILVQRKLVLPAAVRDRLLAAATDKAQLVRYAVAYALAREQPERQDAKGNAALAKLAGDTDAEVKAAALRGLSSRAGAPEAPALAALADADWRVRVEALRLLTSDKGTEARRAKAAAWLTTEWGAIARDEPALSSARVQPLLEGLARLVPFGKEPAVGALFATLRAARPAGGNAEAVRTADTIHCLAMAAGARAGATSVAEVAGCGEPSGVGWPVHLRKSLAAELVGEGLGGSLDERVALLEQLAGDTDVRVRAAAVGAAVSIDDPRTAKLVRAALGASEQVLLETAADAIAARAEKLAADSAAAGKGGGKAPAIVAVRPEFVPLLVERARDEQLDTELRLSLMDALRAAKAADGVPILEAALTDPNGTVRAKAAETLEAITGRKYAARAPRAAAPLPPVPLDDLPALVRWSVRTTKGTFTVELQPYFAPFAVAALTQLARKGFYEGTLWHRVVPDFVVQGGDPTGTGMGGPGFLLPAEPSTMRYLRGTIGIADSGPDTGGSQWFIMHAPAPHLEARYTLVGQVTSGMEIVDSLIVGDRIVKIDVLTEAGE